MKTQLSIITVNYNNAPGLLHTIQSVIPHLGDRIEYIVVDGDSRDGSDDIIKQYQQHISHAVIEPDHGVYHAMNKGMNIANGDFLLYINSGDELLGNDTINNILSVFPNHDLISCDLEVVSEKNTFIKSYPDNPTFKYFLTDSLPHPATFIRKSLLLKQGGFDETKKICSDWAFFILMICKENVKYHHIPVVLSRFYLDGMSSNPKNAEIIRQEKMGILQQHFEKFADLFEDRNEYARLKFIFENSRLIMLLRKIGFFK